jgi:TolA-binding protein
VLPPTPTPEAPPAKEPERSKVQASSPRGAPTPAQTNGDKDSAADLFSAANEARRNGDVAHATRLYHSLQQRFPASTEAQLSLVTLGRLELDSGSPSTALSTFNRYLARGGRPLEAEALYGRALALGRLGSTAQERKAWQALANKHPGSGYAKKAREKLRALAAR